MGQSETVKKQDKAGQVTPHGGSCAFTETRFWYLNCLLSQRRPLCTESLWRLLLVVSESPCSRRCCTNRERPVWLGIQAPRCDWRATARGAQAQAAITDESAARALAEAHRVRTELHALRATRTFRYTAPLRSIYTTLRRRSSGPASSFPWARLAAGITVQSTPTEGPSPPREQ